MRRCAHLIFIVVLAATSWCLDPHKPITQYLHTVWRSEDGLPQNSIQSLLRTRDGYLWIGTQEGLVRFNGLEFKVFNKATTDAIHHNDIRALYEDRDGAVWIGTFGGGLVRYKDGEFKNFSVHHGLSNNSVTSIFQDSRGNLWVGTTDGLNEFIDEKIITFTHKNGLSDTAIHAIAEDAAGRIVVGTSSGLELIVNGRSMGAYSALLGVKQSIKALFRDRKGTLWIGTENNGFDSLSAGKFTHYGAQQGLPNAPVHTIYQDDLGTIWVGTEGEGICRLVGGRFDCYSSKSGLSADFVEAIVQDKEGSLWAGTETGGLNRFKEGTLTNYGTEIGLNGSPRAIFEDPDGSLWIGTSTGLYRMKDGRATPYLTNKGAANNYVYGMFQDHAGNVWVGTDEGGLNKFTGHKVKTYTKADGLADNWIPAIYEDRTGDIWIGTFSGGVSRLHNGKFTNYTMKDGLGSNRVSAIQQDHEGNLLFGTDAGLSRFHDGRFTNIDLQEPSEELGMGSAVMVMYEDADNVLWIGTYGGGLKRMKDGKIATINARQGLFDDTIWSILEDNQGNLWMSSNRGIFSVRKGELNALADGRISQVNSVSYGVADGMQSDECNGGTQYSGWKTRNGKLLFACLKSVVVVDPDNLPHNRQSPPVVIEEVKVNEQGTVRPGASIPPGVGELEFKYAALSYSSPDKVEFKCMLEGLEKNWRTPSTPGFMRYTNLPPGAYTFRVIAANNDGVWNNEGATFSFYLEPRFYQTTWFYFLCSLVVLFSGFGFYLFRTRQIRDRGRQLLVLVSRRTQELQAAKELAEAATRAKSDFLANMSHEIRTPLNGVSGMLDLMDQSELSADQKQLVSMAQDSANSLLAVINDILDFSKIEAGKLAFDVRDFELAETIAEASRTMALHAHKKGLELAYSIDSAVPQYLRGDSGRLKQVLLNLIGNAIKFAGKGEVVLRVITEEFMHGKARLRFAVTDTGIGIPAEKQKVIFEAFSQADASTTRKYGGSGLGLAICSRIVGLMGGKIWVKSEVGKGSTFYFTVLMQVATVDRSADKGRSDLAGVSVLVVDDNASSRNILVEELQTWALKAASSASGKEALRELQRAHQEGRSYQVALVDSRMPGMDGFDLVRELRDSSISTAVIMMLTSDDYYSAVRRCRELGVAPHLLKPVTPFELQVALQQAVLPATAGVEPAELEEKKPVGRFRILLAEDNLINQRFAVRTLEKMGHQIVVAQTGEEALSMLQTEKIDLVLMDVQMPEMDGLAATREIRKRERGQAHIPIIAMTAHAMKGDRESCLDAGMDDYIAKPINREELQQVIERVMKIWKETVSVQPLN